MEFKQPQRVHRRPAASSTKPTASNEVDAPPSVSQAVKSSARMIKSAVSYATKATTKEAKHLLRITMEEFELDENPRWQKLQSVARSLIRKLRLPKWPIKVYLAISLLLVIGLIVMAVMQPKKASQTTKKPQSYTSTKLEKGTPTYDTLLPEGKSIDSLGGWTRVSPPSVSPVYAFADRIDDISIKVSQQPLPKTLDEASEIQEFAKDGGYDQKVTVGGIDVYIGTSGNGPQSAILTKNGLLILIKTDSKLTDAQWADYVASLN